MEELQPGDPQYQVRKSLKNTVAKEPIDIVENII